MQPEESFIVMSSSSSVGASPPSLNGDTSTTTESPPVNGRAANKVCRVCGDRAFGYNFNVVTCESCKAFFRRNALKNKEFRCPFNGNCEVNVVSRRFCQKCRLSKCFEVGMKKEWILSEEVRVVKRQKVSQSRTRKRRYDNFDSTNSEFLHNAKQFVANSDETSDNVTVPREFLIRLLATAPIKDDTVSQHSSPGPGRQCICQCTCGANSPGAPLRAVISSPTTPQPINMQEDIETYDDNTTSVVKRTQAPMELFGTDMSAIEDMFSDPYGTIVNMAISQEMSPVPCVQGQDEPVLTQLTSPKEKAALADAEHVLSVLSVNEQTKLSELLRAHEVMDMPIEDIIQKPENASLLDVFKMADLAIRRIIKMGKRIRAFKTLCQEDQIALLKGGCTEMMILRGVMSYDPERNGWESPATKPWLKPGCIKLEVLKGAKPNIYEEHKRFLTAFNSDCRRCTPIMVILGAICLFNPTRLHVQHSDIIQNEQQFYYALLKKYVDCLFGSSKSQAIYDDLLQKLKELHQLNDNAIRVVVGVNPKDIEPLLIEIFDLK